MSTPTDAGAGTAYSTIRCGGVTASSRDANRLAVALVLSSPSTSHPKFGPPFTHPCTSATKPAELQLYVPTPPTDRVALGAARKSPPGLVHVSVLKCRWIQVASPGADGAPDPPPPLTALLAPSPQLASTVCSETLTGPEIVCDMKSVSVALVMVAPAGILDVSNCTSPR